MRDLPRLHREAEHLGRINIQEGPKGGRSGASAPRWIIVNEKVNATLQLAQEVSTAGSRNLLHRAETYAAFLQRTVLPTREILHRHKLKGFHELRAAYTCERYQQITGHPAAVYTTQNFRINRELDQIARLPISLELGHHRTEIFSAYIGPQP